LNSDTAMHIASDINQEIRTVSTIVITGASSGIGKATATYFAAQGWKVAATMRRPENQAEDGQIDGISRYALDVTDEASIRRATHQILSDFGQVDVVLNNAGYGLIGSFEATTPAQIERQFATNVFGLMSVTWAFLPHFRAKRAGLFMNVSSIGGRVTFPLLSLYHSTKWAVEGFSESLAYELREFGIQVKLIEPGAVDTDFSGRSMDIAAQNSLTVYDSIVQRFMVNQASLLQAGSSPTQIAAGICPPLSGTLQAARHRDCVSARLRGPELVLSGLP
jgi:NAD(P)-dependent dehydrogenase (short-subunit alcohol dehydrogenase family)